MTATVEQIEKIFHKYNKSIFQKQYGYTLPTPVFRVSNAKNYVGLFSYRRHDKEGRSYKISISNFYKLTRQDIIETVIHEMIHEYIQFTGTIDTSSHGPMFRYIMDEINRTNGMSISVCSHHTEISNLKEFRMISFNFNGKRQLTKIQKTKEAEYVKSLKRLTKMGYSISDVMFFNSKHEKIQRFTCCQSRMKYYTLEPSLLNEIEKKATNKRKVEIA